MLRFSLTTGRSAPSPLRGEGGVRGVALTHALTRSTPPQQIVHRTTEPLTRLAKAPLRGTERADLSPQGRGVRSIGDYSCGY
jgi:hypothetical protein